MKEEWRKIPDFDGIYEASNMGRIKSLPRKWIAGSGAERSHECKILKSKIDWVEV